jgi:hypothetical protein
MPAIQITTYDELVAAAKDWLNRGDLDDQVPAFVTLTTAQFNRELRLRDMMVRADTVSDAENVELPDDWLEHYSLVLAPGGSPQFPPLRYLSEKESNEIKAANLESGGTPEGYTVIGNMIELVPAPGSDVELKMVYYQRIPDLGPTNQNNWLLRKSPDLYLYSVLMQAQPYLKDDERLASWIQLRAAIGEAMRLESEASLRPRSGLTARARAF